VVTLAVLGTACTAPPPAPPPPDAPSKLCFERAPSGWTATATATTTVEGSFGVHGIEGDVVFGQTTGTGVTAVDLGSGKAEILARYEKGVSGLGALAAQGPWVVWEQLNSKTNLADWSVHDLNRTTGRKVDLATSRLADGTFAPGQQPLPVLRNGVVAWAQPVKGGAEVRVVDLDSGRGRTLDSGRVSSPVYAGSYLVWAKLDGAYSLHAADAETLEPAQLPEALRRLGSVAYLGGSPELLAWSSHDTTTLNVWRFGTGTLTSYTTDSHHPFQFLHVAGDFLLWYGGITSSVLDLRSGAAFDVAGTVTGSPEWIVTATPAAGSAATRVSRTPTRTAAPRTTPRQDPCS
jgi:hypothetical protein